APGPSADKLAQPGATKVPGHGVAAGAGAFIDDHDLRTWNDADGFVVIGSATRGNVIHDFAFERIDDIISEHAATIESLINNSRFLVNLGEEVAAEIAIALHERVGKVNISHSAVAQLVHFLPVLFNPRRAPEFELALHRNNGHIARLFAIGRRADLDQDAL